MAGLLMSPFSEAIGTVIKVKPGSVDMTLQLEIVLPPSELGRWKRKLKTGSLVGIMAMDDGTIRVREICRIKRTRKEPLIRVQAGG
jgi:hypothetical protein